MKNYVSIFVNIDEIRVGDTVRHQGFWRTVCKKNITRCSWMGVMLWGDSYNLGHKKIEKIVY